MCGIVGRLRLRDAMGPVTSDLAERALQRLAHRGPDGQGHWQSDDGRCWLGHTRLSIIDLGGGAQPMLTGDGRLAISFNGEIYNYRELRAELQALGHGFRTHSDTEVILLGYRAWGASGVLARLQGIFAFAIYDHREHSLFLARDHAGVKPLFWWSDGRELLFASEMKAFFAFPGFLAGRRVNEAGIAQSIVTRAVSRPDTLLAGVHRLPEGAWMAVGPDGVIGAPQRYWDLRPAPEPMQEADAVAELERRLKAVVEQQLVADVPVGVQLSGGVDSSLIAALMDTIRRERGEAHRVRSFSIGFDIPQFSELPYAAQVARRYDTEHHEIVIGANDFVRDFARLCWYYDEPMGEPSAIPTYYMCQRASEHVTVMLRGEGADERFGGYSKYTFEGWAQRLALLPPGLRLPLLRKLATLLPFRMRRLRSLVEIAAIPSQAERFASWFGAFDTPGAAELMTPAFRQRVGDGGLASVYEEILSHCTSTDTLERFAYCDGHARMVDDILVKGDRMSMAGGIESRVPFLDHELAAFSARVPASLKISGNNRKHVLKKVAEKYLPHEVIYRRKVGFTVPLTRWFTGPLAPMIRGILLSPRALEGGYFVPERLRDVVEGHVQQRVDREQAIWVLLALEIWHRLFIDDDGSPEAVTRVGAELAAAA